MHFDLITAIGLLGGALSTWPKPLHARDGAAAILSLVMCC